MTLTNPFRSALLQLAWSRCGAAFLGVCVLLQSAVALADAIPGCWNPPSPAANIGGSGGTGGFRAAAGGTGGSGGKGGSGGSGGSCGGSGGSGGSGGGGYESMGLYPNHSLIDNIHLEHIHDAMDYEVAPPATPRGCSSCANLPSGPATLDTGSTELPDLMLKRIHRPRVWYQHSSFGPGVFSNFDAQLNLEDMPDPGGGVRVFLFDPGVLDLDGSVFTEVGPSDNQVDGVLWPIGQTNLQFQSLRLYTASGTPATTQATAATAVARRPDGREWFFEIIQPRSASQGESAGRLIRMEDRNDNAIIMSYQFPRNATDAQLGYDRDKLWVMTSVADPHGRSISFSYTLQGAWNSWVISQAQFPNGQHTVYHYSNADILPLQQIDHPDGSVSTFVPGEDDIFQEHLITYNDPAAGGTHRKKTISFTRDTFYDSEFNETINQVPYLVRSAFNGSGELAYYNDPDVSNPSTIYAFSADEGFARFHYEPLDRLTTDFATNGVINGAPQGFSYESSTDLQLGDFLKVAVSTDGLGHQTLLDYTGLTGKPTTVTYPDETVGETTYNAFAEPSVVIDRIGRETQYTYDAKGNLVMEVRGSDTADASIWRYEYNNKGQVTRAFDPNYVASSPTLHVTDYVYNSAGYLASRIDSADFTGGVRPTTNYLYDSVGRLIQTTSPAGQVVQFAYDSRNRLTLTTYGDGSTEALTYGSGPDANLLVQSSDRNGNITRYAYDAAGREISKTTAFGKPEAVTRQCSFVTGSLLRASCTERGNREDYAYDHRRRLIGVTSHPTTAVALSTQSVLNNNGLPLYVQDAYGRRTYSVYDINDRQVRRVAELVPGALSPTTNFATLARSTAPNPPYLIEDTIFSAVGEVIEQLDGRSNAKRWEFDAQGRLTAAIDAAGTSIQSRTEYRYDDAGNRILEKKPRAFAEAGVFETVLTYTGRNLLASVTEGAGTSVAATKAFTYSPSAKLLTETDFRGNVTTLGYTSCCDRLTTRTDPSGAISRFTYDSFGNVLTSTDGSGNVTRMTYDGLNRLLTRTNGANETTSISYDDNLTDGLGIDAQSGLTTGLGLGAGSVGSATKSTDPLGHTHVLLRDGLGRSVREVDGNGNATTTTFDVLSSGTVEVSTVDALGQRTKVRTDAAGRTRQSIDAAGCVTTHVFDSAGNEVSVRDANSTGQDCQFDAQNRRTSCTDTQGDVSAWAYDSDGNVVRSTDGSGQITTRVFDPRNRKVTETDRIGGVTAFTYDKDNNVVSVTDAEGKVSSYTFDSRGLLTRETFPAQQAGIPNIRNYTYDASRRLATRTDQTGLITTYVYDAADRLIQKQYPDSLNDVYAYDLASRLTSAASGRYGTTVTRTYDNGDRMLSETQRINSVNYLVGYAYDAGNRKVQITYPDSTVINRAYTNRNQLSSAKVGTTLVASRVYDPGMRLTRTTFGNGLLEDRAYRADNLVSSIVTTGINQLAYSYDQNKRVTQESNPLLAAEALTYGYDAEDRLINWKRGPTSAPVQAQLWSLSLVGDWQTTTRDSVLESRIHSASHEITALTKAGSPQVALNHDGKGNLTLTEPGQTLTWDPENRLVSASAPTQSGTGLAAATYKYDPFGRRLLKVTGGLSTVFVHDGDQVLAEYENGTFKRKYVYGTYIDEPLAVVTPTGTRYYHQNRTYSVMALSNSAGQLAERYGYTAYGKRRVVSPAGVTLTASAVGNQVGFTGRYHDGETGLTYFRARYQSPDLGRFVSRDARGYISGLSLYQAYFVPRFFDPSGEAPGDPFGSALDAAEDWGNYYNGASITNQIEYSSAIYYNQATGQYYYTPAQGGDATSSPFPVAPPGTDLAAGIHSHGAYEPGYTNNEFSPPDRDVARKLGEDLYVATPNGSLLRKDKATGLELIESEDMPSDPNDPDRRNNVGPNLQCE